ALGRCVLKWIYDLRIGTKLQLSFALVSAIAIFVGWIGLAGSDELKSRSTAMYHDRLVPIRDLGYAHAAFLSARTEVRNMLMAKDDVTRRQHIALIEEETKRTDDYLTAYKKTSL